MTPGALDRARHGGVVAVVGPDGVGKTTVAAALSQSLTGLPVVLMRQPSVLPHRTRHSGPVTEPHSQSPDGPLLSLAKTLYLYVDFALGWLFRVRPITRRGGWVIAERGWWDYVVDPRRYRLHPSTARVARWLGRMLPRSDLVLVLEAPAETILARKSELTASEISRQIDVWRQLPLRERRVYIDASRPTDEVVGRAAGEVLGVMRSGASENAAGWTRHPRWILPRAPRQVAAASLRIYHPVTMRARAGWEAARVIAKGGGFRLFPKGKGAPAWIVQALTDHIPKGGSFAVSRANHPSRYTAMVLTENGDPHSFAKLANDDKGREALRNESTALTTLTAGLPAPLAAPRVLYQKPGLLLLEPFAWKPRLRPWMLPPEVASAMGVFNRSGSQDGDSREGLSHGDFAPWNLLKTETGWGLIDWEESTERRPPFFDVFHYIVQGHSLLRRPDASSILNGLTGQGWIGEAISAYAGETAVSAAELDQLFVDYLRESLLQMRLETAEGRRGFESRSRLLETLQR